MLLELSFSNQTLLTGNLVAETTASTAVTGSVYGIAELGTGVGSTPLSNKRLYPNYSRIFPSISLQVKTIRDVILHYGQNRRGWTDLALLSTTEELGVDMAKNFISQLVPCGWSLSGRLWLSRN